MKIIAKINKFYLKLAENNRGISLVELMVAISIIGATATIASAQIDDILPMARDAQRKANIRQVQTALNIYYDDHLEYPISVNNMPSVSDWSKIEKILEDPEAMYMPEVPQDPLNTNDYVFKYWSDGQKFKITYETEDPADNSPLTAWGL